MPVPGAPGGVKIVMSGIEELRRTLAAAEARKTAALGGALFREATRIMGEALLETPVDLGTLRGSGTVELPKVSGSSVSVTLGFGGAASAYAVPQHEREDFEHTVGKSKFLSDPMARAEAGLGERVAADLMALGLFGGGRPGGGGVPGGGPRKRDSSGRFTK